MFTKQIVNHNIQGGIYNVIKFVRFLQHTKCLPTKKKYFYLFKIKNNKYTRLYVEKTE